MSRRVALLAAVAAVATGCATARQKDYAKFVAAQPRSILVVPVMNKSVSLTASDYFLSTIPIPLAERGYYVFPVNLVKRLLEDEGLADPGLVHGADPTRLASMFGADAVLYITIERWEAKYILIQTNVTVAFSYVLKDGKTGDTLWEDAQTMVYTSGDGGGGLLGAIVSAAVTRAAPDYMPLARQANANAMRYPGPGFPAGPYRPDEYRRDVQVALPAQDASGAPTKQPASY
jgi:hypothetical protein